MNTKKAKSRSNGALKFGIIDGVFKVNNATIVKTDVLCDNGVIHVIDSVLLPKMKAAPEISAIKRIKKAIDKGVPIFNGGNPGKCADIYRDCLLAISKGSELDASAAKMLDEVLQRAKKMNDDTQRAWVLRKGLDKAYSILAGK